jgi:hypothetical protein
LEFFIDAV